MGRRLLCALLIVGFVAVRAGFGPPIEEMGNPTDKPIDVPITAGKEEMENALNNPGAVMNRGGSSGGGSNTPTNSTTSANSTAPANSTTSANTTTAAPLADGTAAKAPEQNVPAAPKAASAPGIVALLVGFSATFYTNLHVASF